MTTEPPPDYDTGMSDICRATIERIKTGTVDAVDTLNNLKHLGRMAWDINTRSTK